MLSRPQIREAIDQAIWYCREQIELYKKGVIEYKNESLREVLYFLGYTDVEANQIIRFCAVHGFGYCIDPIIANKDGEKTPHFACVWGLDQLESRLRCVS